MVERSRKSDAELLKLSIKLSAHKAIDKIIIESSDVQLRNEVVVDEGTEILDSGLTDHTTLLLKETMNKRNCQ